ncbi:MAG: alpha/beta fold hydrolase [Solirubrobacteraceae bacterium]
MSSIEKWWLDGVQLELALNVSERHIFVRRWRNAARHMTLLHGFPSSSHDWAKAAPALAERFELLALDFLGFGASDKPRDYAYSLGEQADLVEGVWETEGVAATTVVAHDYAVSVTQELLARRAEGTLSTEIERVHFLNGGLYPDVHRPQPIQSALLDPGQGPQISANLNEELFVTGLAPTFAPGYDSTADAVQIWHSLLREDGYKNLHLLISYMTDRKRNETRWVSALETTDIPLAFVWGMLDPVSGAHMAARIRERLPPAPFTAFQDVGHWPMLEAPAGVAAAILNA